MTIRRTIMWLGVPPFLLLALANAVLFYWQEKVELEAGLRHQALAAAVTTAEFAREDAARTLTAPHRAQALRRAAAAIPDLAGLYLVNDGVPLTLSGAPIDEVPAHPVPSSPAVLTASSPGTADPALVTALAPVAPGTFVMASIDGTQSAEQLQQSGLIILLVTIGVVVGGLGLSWFVANGITRALTRTERLIGAVRTGGLATSEHRVAVREVRELGEAVAMMGANSRIARDRLLDPDRRQVSEADAIAAFRGEWLAPLSTTAAGAKVSVRLLGEAAPGCFFVLCEEDGRALLLLGECAGADAHDALANAVAARSYCEAELPRLPTDDCLARARRGYRLVRAEWLAWTKENAGEAIGEGVKALTLLAPEDAERASVYAAKLPGLSADQIVEDLSLLLPPTASGIVAGLWAA